MQCLVAWLLQKMRQESCAEARDSAGAASAKLVLESYAELNDIYAEPDARGTTVFQPLSPTCLLFARKFNGATTNALLDLLHHRSFRDWNYTAAIGAL